MFTLRDKHFYLVRVGLARPACPAGIEATVDNRYPYAAIVVEKNIQRLGHVEATGYTPTGIVTMGAVRRAKMLAAGQAKGWMYVEGGALNVPFEDEITCHSFMSQLQSLLNASMLGATGVPATQNGEWPCIEKVYPFENYLTCSFRGAHFQQAFDLDPFGKRVGLRGGATIDAAIGLGQMPRAETGIRYAFAPALGHDQTYTQGGATSELVTEMVRNTANITEAVENYLACIRARYTPGVMPKREVPMFAPVSLTDKGQILAQIEARGPGVYHFATWLAGEREGKAKSHGGDKSTPGQKKWAAMLSSTH
jgi:hypothetical protein